MNLIRLQDTPRHEPPRGNGFRGDGIAFHDLQVGAEGEPDNHGLQLVEVSGGYATPRHRHNFEQVRVMLEGSFGFGPGLVQHPGSVGYFCEGTYYAQDGAGRSLTLLLQVGGPSRSGFMSRRQLREGIAALREKGEFKDGIFTWYDAQGIKRNKDSYEAVWEHVHGRPIQYAKPQYSAPVLIEPERFAWVPMPGRDGAFERSLGRFNERGLGLAQVRFGAEVETALPRSLHVRLYCCIEGAGTIEGRPYERLSSMRVEAGETPWVRATRETVFFVFDLPRFLKA
jgi:hypothetical protein